MLLTTTINSAEKHSIHSSYTDSVREADDMPYWNSLDRWSRCVTRGTGGAPPPWETTSTFKKNLHTK
ncbi:hypothetical protein E2C01_000854 [Portunus trituberculatus]|uniref:Uncharacterized protein n=1 Tax=Portunus trituberculatus TaxID=210409 RepID=A0A5B7CL13_PORTR|nr:hypothetical protein [Portunus trituberculatus]